MRKRTTILVMVTLLCMAWPCLADDTEVFSGSTINVPPNVLIIFDTSGSMAEDYIPSSVYIPGEDYGSKLSGSPYLTNTVYYVWKEPSRPQEKPVYRVFTSSSANIGCGETRTALDTYGRWMGFIQETSPFGCDSNKVVKLFMGNYLNYLDSPTTEMRLKLDIAKDVVSDLLITIDDDVIRFGLMRYNKTHQGQGGYLIAPIGSTDAQIQTQLDGLLINTVLGGTPLAETLAEAGLYYAGKSSWSNKGDTYTSPIQWRCQKNYVIFMTDGLSTDDEGENIEKENIFTKAYSYYFGKAIGVPDPDGDNGELDTNGNIIADVNGGTHFLDDVAKFLYEEDLMPGTATDNAGQSFDAEDYDLQNVQTFIIAFATGTNEDLLMRAADDSHGNGEFYSTATSKELEGAFQAAIGKILATNASFIAPVVPVSRLNQVYSGNSVYLSLFKPIDSSAFWNGNVKKFGLNAAGRLLQKDGSPATDSAGQILDDSYSCWNSLTSPDGSTTEEGGIGEALLLQSVRKFYTNEGTSPYLTNPSNEFSTSNTALSVADLNVADDAAKSDLIDFIRAEGIYDPGGTNENKRDWVLGDILHSRPATMYDGDKTIIYVGSNDGFMHAFVDDTKGTNDLDELDDDTVSEAWAYVPWDLVGNLHLLKDSTQHQYYVDGSPVLYRSGANQQLTFGLRRGGNKYYTLKVGEFDGTNAYIADGYLSPQLLWEIPPDILTTETLGESWFRPIPCSISIGGSLSSSVLLFTGGYDSTNQDLATPAASDSVGRAVFAADASTGALVSNINFNHSNYAEMNTSIVDMMAFDSNNDTLTDTIYAGSLGGKLFGFNDRDKNGGWDGRLIFKARDGATASMQLKFQYEPDATMETPGGYKYDYVYIGTGDREHPNELNTVNRFYAIKSTWATPWTPLTEANLVDVTSYNYTTDVSNSLISGNGWFIKLNKNAGEKVVSSPLVFNKIVFFTTFVPDDPSVTVIDECSPGLGGGRLYALDYMTGKAALNFNTSNDTTGKVLDDTDRSINLGEGIPSAPTLVVTEEGAKLLIGSSGAGGTTGAKTIDIPSGGNLHIFYWKEQPTR